MGGEIHQAVIEAGFEIRMVAFLVGDPGHGVHEGHGLVEALELEVLEDLLVVVGQRPAIEADRATREGLFVRQQ